MNKAFDYLDKGINIIPQQKNKKTRIGWKIWQTEKQTYDDLVRLIHKFQKATNGQMNIAAVAGKISNIVVVDLDNEKAIEWIKNKELPITPTVKTNRGYHLYYKYPKDITISSVQKILGDQENDPIIDIISDKHLITLPPSIHQSGKQYQWIKDRSIFDIEPIELPELFIQLINEHKRKIEENEYNTIAQNKDLQKEYLKREYPTTERIKEQINIFDIINRLGINLDKKENEKNIVKALCPFHNEKTPSFTIYKDTNTYHCFGCGISGDIFSLVQLWKNNDFKDAINWINSEFNLISYKGYYSDVNIEQDPITKIIKDELQLAAKIVNELRYINVGSIYRHLTGEQKKKPCFNEKITVIISELEKMINDINYKITVKHEQLYIYNGAYWISPSKEFCYKFLTEIGIKSGLNLVEASFHKNVKNMHDQVLMNFLDQKIGKTNEIAVNLKNGTIIFDDNGYSVKPFNYKDFFTYQLDFNYDKKAECPIFMDYLDKVLPCKKTQQMLQEYSGYIFTKNSALKLEKVCILYGAGRNGKSVFFDVISSLLGNENKISLSMDDLKEEHYKAMIVDKLLCYSSEMGNNSDINNFKKFASGEPIAARHKYGKAFTAENYCRFMFNTNELPSKVEHTEAFFRRFMIIPFKVKIKENEIDPNLATKIIEKELPGVFNWILDGLERITLNKRFTLSKDSEEVFNDYVLDQDSVKKFINQYLNKDGIKKITKFYLNDIYSKYKSFCDEDGYRPVGKKNFSSRITNLGYDKYRDTDGVYFEENLPF